MQIEIDETNRFLLGTDDSSDFITWVKRQKVFFNILTHRKLLAVEEQYIKYAIVITKHL